MSLGDSAFAWLIQTFLSAATDIQLYLIAFIYIFFKPK